MEASALNAPARAARLSVSSALLRLRSDEQLVALLRGGSRDAFEVIHDRYRQRLFAYVRQMLGQRSPQDAEDLLQEVFARSYTALRADQRPINLRPWLYRVAHNLCIDHMRRPIPVPSELDEAAEKPLHDPFEHVKRREDLSRLVADISRLPPQQKSALLLREINGLSYGELAEALDVSVSAVKSLLVRARVELVETAQARDVACDSIREELLLVCDGGGRATPRTRRHLRDCSGCRQYRGSVQGLRRSFAALSPVAAFGPMALLGKFAGLGSSGGATAGATSVSVGSGAGVGLGAASAAKVAAVVSIAAVTAGGAVEIERRVSAEPESRPTAAPGQPAPAAAPAGATPAAAGWWGGATPFAAATDSSGNAIAPGAEGSAGSPDPTASMPAGAVPGGSDLTAGAGPLELAAAIPAAPLLPMPGAPLLPMPGAPQGAGAAPTPSPTVTPAPAGLAPERGVVPGADPVARPETVTERPAQRPQAPRVQLPPVSVPRPRSPDAPAFTPPTAVVPTPADKPDRPAKIDKPARAEPPAKIDKPARPEPPVKVDRPDLPARPNPPGLVDRPAKPDTAARPNPPGLVDKPAKAVPQIRPEAPGKPVKIDKPAKVEARSEMLKPGRSPKTPGAGLSP